MEHQREKYLEDESRDVALGLRRHGMGPRAMQSLSSLIYPALNLREVGPTVSCINWLLTGLRQWEKKGRSSREMGKAKGLSSHYPLLHVLSCCGWVSSMAPSIIWLNFAWCFQLSGYPGPWVLCPSGLRLALVPPSLTFGLPLSLVCLFSNAITSNELPGSKDPLC